LRLKNERDIMNVGIIGVGTVGTAILAKLSKHFPVKTYDKHKPSDTFEDVLTSDIVFIAVPTDERGGRLDCSIVQEVLDDLEAAEYSGVVCIRSTLRVGYMEEVRSMKLRIVFSPEFLHETRSFEDFENPDYVLMSGEKRDLDVLRQAFFWLPRMKFVELDDRTCEVTKLALNAFAAMKISFGNEMVKLCEEIGANVDDVFELMRRNQRCAPEYMNPRWGAYGGKCLPKDVHELMNCTEGAILIRAVNDVNDDKLREDHHG